MERVKKVVTSIGDTVDLKDDLNYSAAMNKYNKIWTSKGKYKIKNKTKMTIHKTPVKPILIYICSTWGLTNDDAFHRKQPRRVLGIKCPTIITDQNWTRKLVMNHDHSKKIMDIVKCLDLETTQIWRNLEIKQQIEQNGNVLLKSRRNYKQGG